MRLADFIAENRTAIVAEAIFYARTLPPLAHDSEERLGDHIPKILDAIVLDLRQDQTEGEALAKSQGNAPFLAGAAETAAETHGRLRAQSGLSTTQLVAEYRALRASVLRLWADVRPDETIVRDVMRFNEAIDQAIAESIALFTEEMDQMRNVFLGVLGHDLRGPLNAILLTSQLISKMAQDPKISAPLGTLIRSGRRMAALLDTLLEFNRSMLGSGMVVQREPVDLTAECAAELEVLKAALPAAQLVLSCRGDLRGNFDASRVREALANLVSNAAAYGKDAPIEIDVVDLGQIVSIKVTNDGPGIATAEIPHLFEPLRRGTQSQAQRTNLGLGLFIVEQIAVAHGGTIGCVSQPGETVFELKLPK
jgi:signal transduction histidine kinase